jgi:hypothetical protein
MTTGSWNNPYEIDGLCVKWIYTDYFNGIKLSQNKNLILVGKDLHIGYWVVQI